MYKSCDILKDLRTAARSRGLTFRRSNSGTYELVDRRSKKVIREYVSYELAYADWQEGYWDK